MTKEQFGARLRRLRKHCALSQRALAQQIGRKYQSEVGRWETGKVRLPADELPAVADALHMPIDAFYVPDDQLETLLSQDTVAVGI